MKFSARISNRKTFYRVLKISFAVFGLFGLAPYKIGANGAETDYKRITWSLIILIFGPTSFLYHAMKAQAKYSENDIIEDFKDLGCILTFLLLFTIHLFSILKRNQMIKLLSKFSNIEKWIVRRQNTELYGSATIKQFICGLITSFICMILFALNLCLYHKFDLINNLFMSFSFIFGYGIKCLYLSKFLLVVLIIERNFKVLNKNLFQLQHKKNTFETDILIELEETKHIYYKLWQTTKYFNEINSVPILIFVADSTVWIIITTYSLIEDFIASSSPGKVSGLIVLLVNCLQIIAMVVACCLTKKQALKTVHLIQNFKSTDKILLKVIELQLRLSFYNVNFTALDMFDLDQKLLHSIFAAVCSYLIIVVQFEVAMKQ